MQSPSTRNRCTKEKLISAKKLICLALKRYLESDDFKGLSIHSIFGEEIPGIKRVKVLLGRLIQQQRITVRSDLVEVNPCIKRMPDQSLEIELRRLEEWQGGFLAVYPTRQELEPTVRAGAYSGRPFSLEMALGAAHLDFRTFDLAVLEQYRNDPRYIYWVGDVSGYISIHDDHYLGDEMKSSDKVLLPHIGFAYDKSMNRAVAAFLIDLHRLSPEHQQIWHARLLPGDFHLHPIFWQTHVRGIMPKDTVVTTAFLWELHRINELCAAMGKPPLFKTDYWQANPPKNFCFLIRPTAKEFADFCGTLDKMISENINREFFRGEISEEREEVRRDGKVIVSTKATIALLNEWLITYWRPPDQTLAKSKLAVFGEVRKLRNPNAHKNITDVFDQEYLRDQRALLKRAYEAMRLLRLILQSHPQVRAGAEDLDYPRGEVFAC